MLSGVEIGRRERNSVKWRGNRGERGTRRSGVEIEKRGEHVKWRGNRGSERERGTV